MKNVTTGEGGMVTTADEAVARRARALLAHGIEKDLHQRVKADRPWERTAVVPGYNLRMTNLAAAIGCVQMKKLDRMNDRRREIAERYAAGLRGLPLDLPRELPGRRHVHQMYCPRVREGMDRTAVVRGLIRLGVGASIHWEPASHEMPAYAHLGATDADLPVTASITDRIFSLPMYPGLTDGQVDAVIAAVRAATRRSGTRPRRRPPTRSAAAPRRPRR